MNVNLKKVLKHDINHQFPVFLSKRYLMSHIWAQNVAIYHVLQTLKISNNYSLCLLICWLWCPSIWAIFFKSSEIKLPPKALIAFLRILHTWNFLHLYVINIVYQIHTTWRWMNQLPLMKHIESIYNFNYRK